jgi:hypothetical protein
VEVLRTSNPGCLLEVQPISFFVKENVVLLITKNMERNLPRIPELFFLFSTLLQKPFTTTPVGAPWGFAIGVRHQIVPEEIGESKGASCLREKHFIYSIRV